MGKRNFSIDFIQIFANIVDGEFFDWVHHSLLDPGKVALTQITFPHLFWFKLPTLQQFAKIFTQRITPHCFNGSVWFIGLVIITPAGSFTQIHPVGRSITGSLKTFGVNKSLKKIDRVIVEFLPIIRKNPGHTSQQVGGQIGHVDPTEDKEPGIIGNQVKILLANIRRPADKFVPALYMAGS